MFVPSHPFTPQKTHFTFNFLSASANFLTPYPLKCSILDNLISGITLNFYINASFLSIVL